MHYQTHLQWWRVMEHIYLSTLLYLSISFLEISGSDVIWTTQDM